MKTFNEALTAVIDEQHERSVANFSAIGVEPRTRDMFVLGAENARIPYEIDQWIEYPEGTEFGIFNNCREWGVTYSINEWTFCVFEHRNSDEIIIEGCPDAEIRSYGPYGSDSKWDSLSCDSYGEYEKAAKRLETALMSATPEMTREQLMTLMEAVA